MYSLASCKTHCQMPYRAVVLTTPRMTHNPVERFHFPSGTFATAE